MANSHHDFGNGQSRAGDGPFRGMSPASSGSMSGSDLFIILLVVVLSVLVSGMLLFGLLG